MHNIEQVLEKSKALVERSNHISLNHQELLSTLMEMRAIREENRYRRHHKLNLVPKDRS